MTEHDVEIIDNLMTAAEHAVQALDGLTERQAIGYVANRLHEMLTDHYVAGGLKT